MVCFEACVCLSSIKSINLEKKIPKYHGNLCYHPINSVLMVFLNTNLFSSWKNHIVCQFRGLDNFLSVLPPFGAIEHSNCELSFDLNLLALEPKFILI